MSVAKEMAPSSEPVSWLDEVGNSKVGEIDWDALTPDDCRPETLLDELDTENLSNDDPRTQQLPEKLKALWMEVPVISALNGQRVKLPGFVVPLEMDATKIDQFLLMPASR